MKFTNTHLAIIAAVVILFLMYRSKSMEKFDSPLYPFGPIKTKERFSAQQEMHYPRHLRKTKERFDMPRAGFPYHAETPNYREHTRLFKNVM